MATVAVPPRATSRIAISKSGGFEILDVHLGPVNRGEIDAFDTGQGPAFR